MSEMAQMTLECFFNKVSAQNTENIVEIADASDSSQSDLEDDLVANDQAVANSKPSTYFDLNLYLSVLYQAKNSLSSIRSF